MSISTIFSVKTFRFLLLLFFFTGVSFTTGNHPGQKETKVITAISIPGQHSYADDDNMLLGNPSNAKNNENEFDNFLMVKEFYTLSYNRTMGKPNWVSWHLEASDIGSSDRQDDFRSDNTLNASWYQVKKSSYNATGFDRGHICPSADRTSTTAANSATFLMTNMMPQAPRNNRQTWKNLEAYERSLVKEGNEVYIIAGSYGQGGKGSKAGKKNSIDQGRITVPARVWKVLVILPDGNDDLNRITTSTRVIAVDLPNTNTIDKDWKKFKTSVNAIDDASGNKLLSNIPANIRQVLKRKVDDQ